MDCEKFESVLVGELYDELDELTRAAAKRHVAGCARCAARLNGLRATRRLAVLPVVEPPADLEDRILAAASDAQAHAPIERRVSRAISWAGSWAMRPQTAMAALFLLMIGSSALLLRGTASKAPDRANVTVSEQGAPVASAVTGTVARPSDPAEMAAADNAHGTPERRPAAPAAPPPEAPGSIALLPSPAPTSLAKAGGGNAFDELAQGGARKEAPRSKAAAGGAIAMADEEAAPIAQAAPPAGVAMASRAAAAPKAAPAPAPASRAEAAGSGGAAPSTGSSLGGGAIPADDKAAEGALSDFDAGMNAYRARRFVEATRFFDGAAASGDVNAALWAARSVREQSGCGAAVPRLDQLSARAFGTTAGYDATLEAGRCYRLLGSPDAARARLVRLLTVKTHAARAQAELDAMAARPAKPAAESY